MGLWVGFTKQGAFPRLPGPPKEVGLLARIWQFEDSMKH